MAASGIFSGVRVIELAQFVYVPGAGVMMADQGAEVIKIETIEGDPYRTLKIAGASRELGDINIAMEQNNRNKKSVALDLKTEDGREALLKLVETADVFLTSLRPRAIQGLRLDVEDLRARNPRIIYARGNGVGFKGPEANRPGFDASAFWARGGAGYAFTRPGEQLTSPRSAFGDHTGSIALAFGIASALFHREKTGEATVVENSLLSTAAWVLSGDITMTNLPGYETHPATRPQVALMSTYTTSDGAMIQLMILNPEPAWPRVCKALDMADLEHDLRYATHEARIANADSLMPVMKARFASKTFAEWKPILESIDVPWEKIASIHDVADDPQAIANGMVRTMDVRSTPIKIVAGPTAFDGELFDHEPVPAPPLGSHTAEALAEVGYTTEQIADLQKRAVVR